MQVTCGRCHALYEFDASAIEADGYQAQCIHCHETFFVAPPRRQTHIERLFEDDLHASHDGDLPEGDEHGHQVDLPLRPTPPRASRDPGARRGPAFVAAPPPRASGNAASGAGQQAPAGPPRAPEERRKEIEDEWASAQLARPGEPLQPPPPAASDLFGAQGDDDEHGLDGEDELLGRASSRGGHRRDAGAAAYRKRRRSLHREELSDAEPSEPVRTRSRMVVGLAATAVIVTGVVVGVLRSKSLHAPTQVTPPVHVMRDPSPAAREAFDQGVRALLTDTEISLGDAQRHFARAANLEADYTDAWAGLGLAAWLAGLDAQEDEAHVGESLSRSVGLLTQAAQSQGRDASAVHLSQGDDDAGTGAATQAALALAASSLRLRASVHDVQTASERLRHCAGDAFDHIERAGAALMVASQLPVQTPLFATAAALWHSDGPWAESLVPSQLAIAEQLVGEQFPPERRAWLTDGASDDGVPINRGAPWASWRMMARGRLALRQARALKGSEQQAALTAGIEAFQGALRLEPGLRRAQWQLAQALMLAARHAEAKRVLEDLAHGPQAHPRAQAQLARMATSAG